MIKLIQLSKLSFGKPPLAKTALIISYLRCHRHRNRQNSRLPQVLTLPRLPRVKKRRKRSRARKVDRLLAPPCSLHQSKRLHLLPRETNRSRAGMEHESEHLSRPVKAQAKSPSSNGRPSAKLVNNSNHQCKRLILANQTSKYASHSRPRHGPSHDPKPLQPNLKMITI